MQTGRGPIATVVVKPSHFLITHRRKPRQSGECRPWTFHRMLDALFELIAKFLIEFVFNTVLYGVGWVMLKVVTFGRYPPRPPQKHSEELVALFPVAILFVGLAVAFS